ncbi:MAG: hypothetical protein FWH42_05505 [Dehalococcoidia bacterium]|nr:hypothetical protein [Dehalococcoidia bacterium]
MGNEGLESKLRELGGKGTKVSKESFLELVDLGLTPPSAEDIATAEAMRLDSVAHAEEEFRKKMITRVAESRAYDTVYLGTDKSFDRFNGGSTWDDTLISGSWLGATKRARANFTNRYAEAKVASTSIDFGAATAIACVGNQFTVAGSSGGSQVATIREIGVHKGEISAGALGGSSAAVEIWFMIKDETSGVEYKEEIVRESVGFGGSTIYSTHSVGRDTLLRVGRNYTVYLKLVVSASLYGIGFTYSDFFEDVEYFNAWYAQIMVEF